MAAGKETKTSRPIAGMRFGADVLDALARAARHLQGRDPNAHLYFESRHERRIEVDPYGRTSAVASVVQGLAAEHAPGAGAFVSVSRLDDVERLALAATREVPKERSTGGGPRDEEEPDPEGLEVAAALAASASRASGGLPARTHFVEVDQHVAVARRDGRSARDRRHGRRVGLEMGGVVVERVLPREGLDFDGLAEEAAERIHARRLPMPPWPGRTPVVFAPGVGGVLLHELVGHALEGDVVARGSSALARAEGRVAPAGVTVLDDPRRGRVAWKVDDEGTEARPVALLQGGCVAGTLSSWRWPGSAGRARRASFAEPALPRMGATFLTPGPFAPVEVLEGIARGLYVRRMAAAWTEPAKGKAIFHVTDADQVIAGRLERAIEPFFLHVDVEDLALLDRIADDLAFDSCIGVCVREGQALATSVGAPTFRLGLVTVAG